MAATVVSFGEWLPDLPALNNPGLLRAENVYPSDGCYKPLPSATATGLGTLPATPLGGISFPIGVVGGQAYGAVIGTDTLLLRNSTTGAFSTLGSGFATLSAVSGGYWRMAQFDTSIVATNNLDRPQKYDIGGALATLGGGTAPIAQQVGVINKFLLLGDLSTDPYAVQWSGIDNIDSWPTPNSSTAIAQQSGLQVMPATGGTVTGISSGDQFGIIFQRNRITRASYAGPPVVFQFDSIDDSRGCFFPNSLVEVGSKAYFAAAFGFFVTDGVSVIDISDGKCSHRFFDGTNYLTSNDVYGAVDYERKIIMWAFDTGMAIYNYVENRWAYTTTTSEFILTGIAPT